MNSHEDTKTRSDKEELSKIVVDCAYHLHREIGPGLLESVYEVVLAKMLQARGLSVKRQVPVPLELMGMKFDEGFRADILVEEVLLVELKSVENLAPVHSKQVLTYLRLLNLPLGLLLNFGAATFKEGVKRIVNGEQSFVSSCEPNGGRAVTGWLFLSRQFYGAPFTQFQNPRLVVRHAERLSNAPHITALHPRS
jgi:GxxExxY protein